MLVIRAKTKEDVKGSGARLQEDKPSRDVLVISGSANNKGIDIYVKYAAIRYRNRLLLIHTHVSRDGQWLEDVLSLLRKKFRALIGPEGMTRCPALAGHYGPSRAHIWLRSK